MSTATATAPALGGKYLTFALGAEEYGIAILKVKEIVGNLDITAVPRTAHHVKGVVNLRGQVISVIDLRSRFGMPPAEDTSKFFIIVVETVREGRKVFCGVVVDRVREVLNIPNEQIEEPPSLGGNDNSGFILGMGKVGQSVKLLLDIERVVGDEG